MSLIYFWAISDYISIIRINTPSIYLVSYGYKVAFLGFDQLLAEVKQMPTGLAGTWVPITAAVLILILAGAIALCAYRRGISDCTVADNTSGTAFLFGAGIYCGSFMLGANFVYRLMFLLLCLPQLLDWLSATSPGGQRTLAVARFLLFASLLALWLNAYPNFMPVPQVVDWTLLFGLTAVLLLNFLNSANPREIIMTRHAERIVER